MRKQKSFAWYYFWFLMTSGFFAVYWLYSLMEDINAAAGEKLFRSKLVIAPLLFGMTGVLVGLVVLVSMQLDFPTNGVETVFVSVSIFAEIALVLTPVWVYGGLLKLETKSLNLREIGFAIGTSLLMGLIYPYMQIRANEHLAQLASRYALPTAAQ
jgi:hypothetical protein